MVYRTGRHREALYGYMLFSSSSQFAYQGEKEVDIPNPGSGTAILS